MRLIVVLALLLAAPLARAAEPVKREILAVYDGGKEASPAETLIHRRVEMVANHLGYVLVYHDLRQPFPDPAAAAERFVALLTWFGYVIERPTEYLEWAAEVTRRGTKIIQLGAVGVPVTARNILLINRVLEPVGVRFTDGYVDLTIGSRIVQSDPAVMNFERQLDPILPVFPVITRSLPATRVALEVEAPPSRGRLRSVLVATGPGGGLVFDGFDIHFEPVVSLSKWLINPFEFLRRALGDQVFPIPDTTTVSGRRLYFSHIDGDGWNNLSQSESFASSGVSSSEILLRELIAPYPDLPVTVGLVAGDVDPRLGRSVRAARTARAIFAQPQVEVGSHTFTHPFDWSFFERYDRHREEALLRPKTRAPIEGLFATWSELRNVRGHASPLPVPLPRSFAQDPFDLQMEVEGSLRVAGALAPPGKTPLLYQWSGNTRPFEAAVRATRQAGVRNINGGDSRFDDEFPSVGYVAPISRVVGAERQIYAVNSNENTYTRDWSDFFNGFVALRETLARTENPRRLKGVNVYYHVFSAERAASLKAVRSHLEWARKAPLAPISASRYAAIADGFFTASIEPLGESIWAISDRDGLQTVRFDQADGVGVDLAKSEGVLGANRHGGSLYVALDAGVHRAVLALGRTAGTGLRFASLIEARWQISGLRRSECVLGFRAQGFGSGEMTWAGVPGGTYALEVTRGSKQIWQGRARVEPDGVLPVTLPVSAIEPVDVRIACADGPS